MDGTAHRKLGDQRGLSGKQAFQRTRRELLSLPQNDALSRTLCDPGRFSNFLVIDGKYVAVKGYGQKIPFLYGLDYASHDPLLGRLYAAEDEASFVSFFTRLLELGLRPSAVVADDRGGLKNALIRVFPGTRLQLCHTHFLENLRKLLNVRTKERYRHFFNSLQKHVFCEATSQSAVTLALRYVWDRHAGNNVLLQDILKNIAYRREDLFACLEIPGCPNTVNLMESYNSHLQGRLETVKGFQSFKSAALWLNAYLIRRRTKKFTDCRGKFKHLNGHASLELTIQKQAIWPESLTKLGVKKPPYFEVKKH